jgi:hypothetical protein
LFSENSSFKINKDFVRIDNTIEDIVEIDSFVFVFTNELKIVLLISNEFEISLFSISEKIIRLDVKFIFLPLFKLNSIIVSLLWKIDKFSIIHLFFS